MPDASTFPKDTDILALAKERVQVGCVPEWVTPCPFDPGFHAKEASPMTHLLVNQQFHAEQHQIHIQTALRLETMDAVGHCSQWKLEFEPRSQSVVLHWIRIYRGDQEFNHTDLHKIRFLQRESSLERFVIDGWCTLLLLLEDVRPGDVLESCYTIENRPRLLPELCTYSFALPQKLAVGRLRFSVLFDESRPMRWKSSSVTDLAPQETRQGGQVLWAWTRENYAGPEPEVNTPSWHIPYPWIQVSDCPNWNTVASAVANAWARHTEDTTVAEIAKEISEKHADLSRRVEKAIQLVQDEYRYLSVNLESGGYLPAAPDVVARRRYGDCKDLSFLLGQLLKRLGAAARPVLVNASLCKSVAEMLPAPGVFNHVVVEYQVQGQTRWVDVTIKHQGGPLNRFVPAYGLGLPVDPTASELRPMPQSCLQPSFYEQRETILLDTTGACSYLALTVTAKGQSAEMLRRGFETDGPEAVSRNRLQLCAKRYTTARRVGTLQFRDDREANEFVLSEAFEINGFLRADAVPGTCLVPIPTDIVANLLALPEQEFRRTPFALPYPCQAVHTIEIQSPGMSLQTIRPLKTRSEFVQFSRSHKSLSSYASISFSLTTLADAVPPERIGQHRRAVEEIWRECIWQLRMGVGYPAPRRRHDFGQLPPHSRKPSISPLQPRSPLVMDSPTSRSPSG